MRVRAAVLSFLVASCALTAPAVIAAEVDATATAINLLGPKPEEGPEFVAKLQEMLKRTEESAKIARDQITESQAAPFLPDLYMQLADMLAQKANVLYYLQMEKRKTTQIEEEEKAFSPVIQAQKEAIQIYKRVLSDFPKYDGRRKASFRVAVSLKSIDEIPTFIKVARQLIAEYPNSEEAMKMRILLGQHHFEQGDFDEARSTLAPVLGVPYVYEKNLALYRTGLIDLAQDRWKDALTRFEAVIKESSLQAAENPYEISLKSRRVKSDLRREALLDSIRAYTHVHAKDPNPVAYYSALAPSETLFQEVIEKLAVRYIGLKKYTQAVTLLRTMSERIADPQKVIAIYRDVLLMIPPGERIGIPPEEIRFVLDRYVRWTNYFPVPAAIAQDAGAFFEKNVRSLGTTSHDIAKAIKKSPKRKVELLQRARDFYLLYLAYFNRGPQSVKMATNLADVYYALGQYFLSGEYYLRIYQKEFGTPTQSRALIENAIFALQRPEETGYYENIRKRGLLIEAIESYTRDVPSKRNQPGLILTSLKAQYEQSIFPETLEKLYEFMGRFRNSRESVKAGEMILDYYNTRGDYAGLEAASTRILAMKLPDAAFRNRVANLRTQAKGRAIQDKLRASGDYDDFAQGRSYLAAALKSGDTALADEVLAQALARSKIEKDFQTFLTAGKAMASKEGNGKKRAAIIRSVANEQFRVARYYDGIATLEELSRDPDVPTEERTKAADLAVSNALLLRDWNLVGRLLGVSKRALSDDTERRLREQSLDLIGAGMDPSPPLLRAALDSGLDAASLYAIYRAQNALDSNSRTALGRALRRACGKSRRQPACLWESLPALDQKIEPMLKALNGRARSMDQLQKVAQSFARVASDVTSLEGAGDILWDGAVTARAHELYQRFSEYLSRTGSALPDLKPVLEAKAQEAQGSAGTYLQRCRRVREFEDDCGSNNFPSAENIMRGSLRQPAQAPGQDPDSEDLNTLRRNVFGSKEEARDTLELAKTLYRAKQHHHAAALSTLGVSRFGNFAGEFRTILGCSVVRLGLKAEARYHLKSASDVDGWKAECLAAARSRSE